MTGYPEETLKEYVRLEQELMALERIPLRLLPPTTREVVARRIAFIHRLRDECLQDLLAPREYR